MREVAGSTALFLVPSNICGKVDGEVMDAAGPQLKYFIFFKKKCIADVGNQDNFLE